MYHGTSHPLLIEVKHSRLHSDRRGHMSEARMRHGSETFFIEGEGLLTTQVGGRTGQEPDPVTEPETPRTVAPRTLAADAAPPFRFSRVGPKGTPLGAAATRKLARAMVVGGGGAGTVPA